MQVESVPTLTALPETPLPAPADPSSQPAEVPNESPPVTEEAEQPTFHVMQPPAPASTTPSEPPVALPPATYTQLIAVPIASEQPAPACPPTVPVKQTKRVRFSGCLPHVLRSMLCRAQERRRIINKSIALLPSRPRCSLDHLLERRRSYYRSHRKRFSLAIR